jgi:hypothetical protein
MATLSWGKCLIIIRKILGDGKFDKFIVLNTPAEDTAEGTTTKGDKMEAKVEGGDIEAQRYLRSNYALAANIRGAKGRKKPVKDIDGVVEGEYQVFLQPEDPTAIGLIMPQATISVEDTYTAKEGVIWKYTFDASLPDDGGEKQLLGYLTIDPASPAPGAAVTSISFVEIGEGDESDKSAVTYGNESKS